MMMRKKTMARSKCPTFAFLYFFSYLPFCSIEITPPPTPSPVKRPGGKKRAMQVCESDNEDVFVPRYIPYFSKNNLF